jgi:hypothetical protein
MWPHVRRAASDAIADISPQKNLKLRFSAAAAAGRREAPASVVQPMNSLSEIDRAISLFNRWNRCIRKKTGDRGRKSRGERAEKEQ